MKLTAGDDATDCHWLTADLDDPGFKLYASHRDFLKMAIDKVKLEVKTFSALISSPNGTTIIGEPILVVEQTRSATKDGVPKR